MNFKIPDSKIFSTFVAVKFPKKIKIVRFEGYFTLLPSAVEVRSMQSRIKSTYQLMRKMSIVLFVLLFLSGLHACDNGKKKLAERVERARQDSLWKAKPLPIVLEKPSLRPNAIQVLDSWPSLDEFDAYLNRYVKLNRGEAVQGIDALVEATETLFEGYIPEDADIPHIRSRLNLLRNFILKYQDNLLDADITDSTLQRNLAEIKSAYLGIYTQLNKVNQYNPNQELLDTIE